MTRLCSIFEPGIFIIINLFYTYPDCSVDLMPDILTGIFLLLMILKLDFVGFKIASSPNYF